MHVDIFVRPGDSLWHFSEVFKIPLPLILDSNTNINPQFLRVGQRIRIPGFVTINYQVKQGDSLWQIAQRYNLPLIAILLVNPGLHPNQLQIGQMIHIPQRLTWRLIDGKQNYTYNIMMNDIQRLVDAYPFLRSTTIGSSVLSKEIPELLIGNGTKRVHYNGSFHANEWITTPIILTFLNDYLLALTNQNNMSGLSLFPLYQQTTLSVVPMVNPDGVNLVIQGPPNDESLKNQLISWNNGSSDFSGWKANIHGVDLNDQFPAKWELESARNPKTPGPRDYGG
ncbi:LysM peptidoglycan-binding domain-containing protein, partial [Lysinibacillus sphaericus]